MEWVIGIACGLVTYGITEGGTVLWRRKWNPVVWTMRRVNSRMWTLTRVANRRALNVTLRARNIGELPDKPDMVVPDAGRPQGATYEKGDSSEYELLQPGEHYLYWIERDSYWCADIGANDAENHIDVRRLDVRDSSGKKVKRSWRDR